MPRYKVHLFPIGHVIFDDVDADTMPEAIDKAEVSLDMHARMREGVEFNEGYDAFLVDVIGDAENSESRWFKPDGKTLLYPVEVGEPVEFNVLRTSREETTSACITARVTRDGLKNIVTFRDVLMDALTEWVNATDSGRDAWQCASENLNVGDLSEHLDDSELTQLLEGRGIHRLQVEVSSSYQCQWTWTYDEVLVNEDALDSEEVTSE